MAGDPPRADLRIEDGGAAIFASKALETAAAAPGVRSAALAENVPFNRFMRVGTPIQTSVGSAMAEYYANSVSPAYFETMGIPMIAGRAFSPADRKGAPHVVILNEALSKRLFGNGRAVGERIWFGEKKEGEGVVVVGVAANYQSIARTQPSKSEINVLVRTEGDPAGFSAALRETLSNLDTTAAVEVGPLRTKLMLAYLPSQIGAVLVGSLGGLGLVLALIGIYGTMAFAVSRRTAEIGIRMALGASAWNVARTIFGVSLGTMGAGFAIGFGLAVLAAQPLAAFLAEGITPFDPATFGWVIAICLVAGVVATIIPARKALTVNPIRALRVD